VLLNGRVADGGLQRDLFSDLQEVEFSKRA
jgi:hypothetical protein